MLSLDEQLHKILSHYIGNYVTADEYESDVKEAGQAIQVLIAQQVREAKLEELDNCLWWFMGVEDEPTFTRESLIILFSDRIAALKGDK